MRQGCFGVCALALCLTFPAIGTAQERAPHAGSAAVGVDVGAFVPSNDRLENAAVFNVLYEYYLTARVSLRTDFGLTNPGFQSAAIDSLRQVPVRLDVNYNWEHGKWHPFVGTGVGAYFLQFKNNGQSVGDSETKIGVNVGGGIERFVHRNVSLKAEGRYHAIPSARFGQDPSGVVFTGGIKTYF